MKKLSVRVGEYEKDGQTKGRYVNVGVLVQKDGKEYVLLDPSVSIAGLMVQQQSEAMKKGEALRDRVMVGVFEDQPQQSGYQQQSAPQQGGYQQNPTPQQQAPIQQQGAGYYDHNKQ